MVHQSTPESKRDALQAGIEGKIPGGTVRDTERSSREARKRGGKQAALTCLEQARMWERRAEERSMAF